MGFVIARRNGRYGMRAVCDSCSKEVVDGECNVLSQRFYEEGRDSEIKIACKEKCTDRIDPNRSMANQELGRCVLHFIRNAGIDISDEERKDKALSTL